MAAKKSPTAYRILALSSNGNPIKFASVEEQLNEIAADGWTIHITRVDVTIADIFVYGWATK